MNYLSAYGLRLFLYGIAEVTQCITVLYVTVLLLCALPEPEWFETVPVPFSQHEPPAVPSLHPTHTQYMGRYNLISKFYWVRPHKTTWTHGASQTYQQVQVSKPTQTTWRNTLHTRTNHRWGFHNLVGKFMCKRTSKPTQTTWRHTLHKHNTWGFTILSAT